MPLHKIQVDLYGEMGEKYTITFQGRITREKSLRLLDLVELLGGMREFSDKPTWARGKKKTKFERVRMIVQEYFPLSWFSSKEIQHAYEKEYKELIQLSTVSTYLARLTDRNFLLKRRRHKRIRYKLASEILRRYWMKEKVGEEIVLRH